MGEQLREEFERVGFKSSVKIPHETEQGYVKSVLYIIKEEIKEKVSCIPPRLGKCSKLLFGRSPVITGRCKIMIDPKKNQDTVGYQVMKILYGSQGSVTLNIVYDQVKKWKQDVNKRSISAFLAVLKKVLPDYVHSEKSGRYFVYGLNTHNMTLDGLYEGFIKANRKLRKTYVRHPKKDSDVHITIAREMFKKAYGAIPKEINVIVSGRIDVVFKFEK